MQWYETFISVENKQHEFNENNINSLNCMLCAEHEHISYIYQVNIRPSMSRIMQQSVISRWFQWFQPGLWLKVSTEHLIYSSVMRVCDLFHL